MITKIIKYVFNGIVYDTYEQACAAEKIFLENQDEFTHYLLEIKKILNTIKKIDSSIFQNNVFPFIINIENNHLFEDFYAANPLYGMIKNTLKELGIPFDEVDTKDLKIDQLSIFPRDFVMPDEKLIFSIIEKYFNNPK